MNTHFSPLSGDEDAPENYHTLTWTLEDAAPAEMVCTPMLTSSVADGATVLTLSQDNNATPEAAEHSRGMWDSLVAKVKEIAEGDPAAG